jgi:Mrp family chromosome partitioning ATPase
MSNSDLTFRAPLEYRTSSGGRTEREVELAASLPDAEPSGPATGHWLRFALASVGTSRKEDGAQGERELGSRKTLSATRLLQRLDTGTSEPRPGNGTGVPIHLDGPPAEMARLHAALEARIPGWIESAWARSADDAAGCYLLGITSAVAGEGKTTVALHLAWNIARDTLNKVCLIDLSLGEDELARRLGVSPPREGLMGLLEEQGQTVQALQVSGCDGPVFMLAGRAPARPSRVARSPRVPELIGATRPLFDVVIVDLPAIFTENALPLANQMDGLVVVTRAGATPEHVVNRALDQIGRTRVLGIVLNGVKSSCPNWLQRRLLGR